MNLLLHNEAQKIRTEYIDSFINRSSEYYRVAIEKKHLYKDGLCYDGYLWDCYISPIVVGEKEAISYIEQADKLFVMWDIHSCEKIYIPNYWKFPKEAVIVTDPIELIKLFPLLPEDIYLFDNTFSWTVALTHEVLRGNTRYCIFCASQKHDA